MNEYHFGGFKGDPLDMMKKYYDAFFYYANWGSRILMFKIPKKVVEWEAVSQYCLSESMVVPSHDKNLVFYFGVFPEDPDDDWYEWEMSSLISLRSDLTNFELKKRFKQESTGHPNSQNQTVRFAGELLKQAGLDM